MIFFFEHFFPPLGAAGQRGGGVESSGSSNSPQRFSDTSSSGRQHRQANDGTPRRQGRTPRDDPPPHPNRHAHPLETMFSPEGMFSSLFGSAAAGGLFAGGGGLGFPFTGEVFGQHGAAAAAATAEGANSQPRGPPPCSRRTLAQLPRVAIAPIDLVIDNNRVCSVCLESHAIGDVAVRLPCAHLFHADCVLPWLHKSCACPVCRYELPTDDPDYERIRVERMRSRKPRFYEHELQRLSIAQLNRLGGRPAGCRDKESWTRHLRDQNLIEVIPTPPPAVLHWKHLQEMSTSQLKACMEENGVFYDPKHVLEKSDLLAVFCNSGRLQLVKDDDDDDATLYDDFAEKTNVVDGFSTDDSSDSESTGPVHSIAAREVRGSCSQGQMKTTERGNLVFVETVDDCQARRTVDATAEELLVRDVDNSESDDGSISLMRKRRRGLSVDPPAAQTSRATPLLVEERLATWSLMELRDCAHHLAVDTQSCLERDEIVERVGNAVRAAFDDMTRWGASELRAVASVLNVPFAGTGPPTIAMDLVKRRLLDSPQYAFVFSGMSLMRGKSVPRLRALGSSWNVDVSDCLEKAEIMQRLLLHHQFLHRKRTTR